MRAIPVWDADGGAPSPPHPRTDPCACPRERKCLKNLPPHPAQILCKYLGGGRTLPGAWILRI